MKLLSIYTANDAASHTAAILAFFNVFVQIRDCVEYKNKAPTKWLSKVWSLKWFFKKGEFKERVRQFTINSKPIQRCSWFPNHEQNTTFSLTANTWTTYSITATNNKPYLTCIKNSVLSVFVYFDENSFHQFIKTFYSLIVNCWMPSI